MPRVTMQRAPKVVTDKPKLLAAQASAIARKPMGREAILSVRIRLSA